jgi:uncharacterized membrane protein YhaH (DUF805 family)
VWGTEEMGFGEAIRVCFSKYADFRGRARRSEYWYFILFCVLVRLVSIVLGPLSIVVGLALFLPQLSVMVRRFHDTGRSGWWILGFYGYLFATVILFLATSGAAYRPRLDGPSGIVVVVLGIGGFAYAVWLFILTVLDGTNGPNEYGPDPKGPDVEVFT